MEAAGNRTRVVINEVNSYGSMLAECCYLPQKSKQRCHRHIVSVVDPTGLRVRDKLGSTKRLAINHSTLDFGSKAIGRLCGMFWLFSSPRPRILFASVSVISVIEGAICREFEGSRESPMSCPLASMPA